MANRYNLVLEGENQRKQYIKFKAGEEITDKAMLEQIDWVTSRHDSLESFLMSLRKEVSFQFAPEKAYITYQYNGEEKKLDLVFNNPEITRVSLQVLKKKKKKEKLKKENKNQELAELYTNIDMYDPIVATTISELKTYATMQSTSSRLLSTLPFRTKNLMEDYIKTVKLESTAKRYELNEIDRYLRMEVSDYKTCRDIQISIQKIRQFIQEEKQEEVPSEYVQMHILDYLQNDFYEDEKLTEEEKRVIEEEESKYAKEKEELEKFKDEIYAMEGNIEETAQFIEDISAMEAYLEAAGDPSAIINLLGTDKAESLSDNDKYAMGISDDLVEAHKVL